MKTCALTDLPLVVYDCFTNTRFGGNVGGIVLNAGDLSAEVMQKIAGEINAPVTGFITAQDGREISIRFFMPAAEIAMCGHVTVGLFSYFTDKGGLEAGDFVMKTQAGDVQVSVSANQDAPPVVLIQATVAVLTSPDIDTAALAAALGLPLAELGRVNPLQTAQAGLTHLIVQLDSLEKVQSLAPDFRKLTEVSNACGAHTIACFAMQTEDPAHDLHIRDFCPAVGADEVPASGTTNAALAGYLVRHGLIPEGQQTVLAEQGNELGRPSLIRCDINSAAGTVTQVRVGGQAVASISGVVSGI